MVEKCLFLVKILAHTDLAAINLCIATLSNFWFWSSKERKLEGKANRLIERSGRRKKKKDMSE